MKIVKKYHRTATERRFLFRMLTTALVHHGQIKTTAAKAKELRRFADHVVTLAQHGDQFSRRRAAAFLFGKDAVDKLFSEFPERYPNRRGGFTRVRLAGYRKGDKSQMAYIEFIEPDVSKTQEVPIAAAPAAESKKAEEL